MQQSCAVQFFYGFCSTFKITAKAGFISHRPHYYGRMITIPFYHANASIHISLLPGGIIGNPVIPFYPFKAMAFQIRLVNYIKSIFIAKIIKMFICRVVGTAYRVDITLLHEQNICLGLLICNTASFFGIIIMMIYTI